METVFNFIRGGGTFALLATMLVACGGDDSNDGSPGTLDDARPVMSNYAANVRANATDSLTTAMDLKVAVDAFVAAQTEEALTTARDAWKAAREPYGLSEAFRFYGGPIDGPESLMNSWPLDEAYIDYVVDAPTSGLVNDPTNFPIISEATIAAKNAADSETHIATGYHAIEFLLWGQDLSADGAGMRPASDYAVGGRAANPDRRAAYLQAATNLLIADLTQVNDAWADGGDNYRAEFIAAEPKEALRRMLLGMGSLAGSELSGERLATALANKDQEDEQSCFSDNTLRDLRANALAIENVYLGRYGANDGPGIDDLVEARDPALNAKLKAQLTATNDAIAAIPFPFDQTILDLPEGSHAKGLAAVTALLAETDTIVEVGTLLGIQINLE